MSAPVLILRMTVPGLPKAKGRTKTRVVVPKSGKPFATVYTPAATRNEEAVIRDMAAQVMGGAPPLEGPVELRVTIYLPIPASWSRKRQQLALDGLLLPTTKPDWDNAAKITAAVNGILWRDDSQVTDAHIFKRYSDRPRVVIEVRPIVGKLP